MFAISCNLVVNKIAFIRKNLSNALLNDVTLKMIWQKKKDNIEINARI